MQCLEARVASFDAITRPKRSAKIAFPLDPDDYPNLTPLRLAQAGFFHNPSKTVKGPEDDGSDDCKTFCCGLKLGGWDNDDDPFVEHLKREGDCPWKEIVCRLEVDSNRPGGGRERLTYSDADLLPQSKRQTTLREKTFGKKWKHKRPSAKEVAKAGFIYAPSQSAEDGTQCPYCQYEAMDWEPTDDPWGVHYAKRPTCPFFAAEADKKVPTSKSAKPPVRRGRSTVTRDPSPEPEPQDEDDGDSLELPDAAAMEKEAAEEEEEPAPRRRGRPPKASIAASVTSELSKSTSTRAASGRRKTAATKAKGEAEAMEIEKEEAVEKEEPARATKPLPRKRTTRTTAAAAELAEAAEPAPAPKPRGRPKKTAPTTTTETVAAPAPARATKSTARSKAGKPLTQADSLANVVAPSLIPVTMSPSPRSPSVRHAVASMLREASPAASPAKPPAAPKPAANATAPAPVSTEPSAGTLATLTEAQRKMTLEEYIREQYSLRAGEMRADGEAMIQKFEARAQEARGMLERG